MDHIVSHKESLLAPQCHMNHIANHLNKGLLCYNCYKAPGSLPGRNSETKMFRVAREGLKLYFCSEYCYRQEQKYPHKTYKVIKDDDVDSFDIQFDCTACDWGTK